MSKIYNYNLITFNNKMYADATKFHAMPSMYDGEKIQREKDFEKRWSVAVLISIRVVYIKMNVCLWVCPLGT